MALRLLIVALVFFWHAPARADLHLALETSLLGYRVEAAHPNSPVPSFGLRRTALSWHDALALRAGYRWRSGVELGVGSELGYERDDGDVVVDLWRARPCAYGRYVFAGTRVRPFLGALLASEFVGTTQAREAVYYWQLRQRSIGFGVEGGAHLYVLPWLTFDAFARFQVLWTRSKLGTWDESWHSDGLESGFHLTTIGFALSAWL